MSKRFDEIEKEIEFYLDLAGIAAIIVFLTFVAMSVFYFLT